MTYVDYYAITTMIVQYTVRFISLSSVGVGTLTRPRLTVLLTAKRLVVSRTKLVPCFRSCWPTGNSKPAARLLLFNAHTVNAARDNYDAAAT